MQLWDQFGKTNLVRYYIYIYYINYILYIIYIYIYIILLAETNAFRNLRNVLYHLANQNVSVSFSASKRSFGDPGGSSILSVSPSGRRTMKIIKSLQTIYIQHLLEWMTTPCKINARKSNARNMKQIMPTMSQHGGLTPN